MQISSEAKKTWKIRGLVLLGLLILVEIVLRVIGMKPGVLLDDFIVEENPTCDVRFYADEFGITHMNPAAMTFMRGTKINEQGFRGDWNYTEESVDSIKAKGKKVIMIVGDSFVEGCCATNVRKSFPDLLITNNSEVMNFGISASDPVHYRLIVERYLDSLKPDYLVISVFLGNDILAYDKTPKPGVPTSYPFISNKWLMSEKPFWLTGKFNEPFQDWEQAYTFYLDHYTLKGKKRNFIERLLSYSVITSKLYLGVEHFFQKRKVVDQLVVFEEPPFTYQNLLAIQNISKKAGVPCFFVAIPSAKDVSDFDNLKTKYAYVFNDLPWNMPKLSKNHYDGSTDASHFNDDGHKIYAKFLRKLLKL